MGAVFLFPSTLLLSFEWSPSRDARTTCATCLASTRHSFGVFRSADETSTDDDPRERGGDPMWGGRWRWAVSFPGKPSDEADGCGFDFHSDAQKVGDAIDVVCGRRPNKQRGLNWKDFRLRTTLYMKKWSCRENKWGSRDWAHA